MSSWSEIQQLQADLEKIQQSTTTQRLSERNCIEILMKLEEMKLIDVLHSSDGKEYLTPKHLLQEIRQEVDAHGGRANTIDLQSLLNVDFWLVEKKSQELARVDKEVQLINGQLLTNAYLDSIADEINETLQANGHVTLGEMSRVYDLPGDFLSKEMTSRIGRNIEGMLDKQQHSTIYTEEFIAKHKCRIRGMLSATTRPLGVGAMCSQEDLTSQLATMIVRNLMRDGRVKGQLSGGSGDAAVFAPQIYSQTQTDWIDDFFKQNDYIEYATAMKLGGVEATSQLRKRLSRFDPVHLKTVCVGASLVGRVAALVEDTLVGSEWNDVSTLLPPSFTDEDVRMLLEHVSKSCKADLVIFCDVIVTSRRFLDLCQSYFDTLIVEKAEKEASKATVLSISDQQWRNQTEQRKPDKKGERRRRAQEGSGSSKRSADYGGAGQGGREVKMKGSDKKRMRWQREQEEAKKPQIKPTKEEAIGVDFVEFVLRDRLPDCPDPMIQEVGSLLIRPLNTKYEAAVKSVFIKRQSDSSNEKEGGGSRRSRKELEEEINRIWFLLQIFRGSFGHFTDEQLVLLYKHLLQGVCTQLTDLLFLVLQIEFAPNLDVSAPLSDKVRSSLLPKFPPDMRLPMNQLSKLVAGKNYEAFIDAIKEAASPAVCDVMLKNVDKKKEKQLSHNYKMSLLKQLEEGTEPATCFHAVVAVIFQSMTGFALDIPGKLVPAALQSLRNSLERDVFLDLLAYQEQVMRFVAMEESDRGDTEKALKEGLPRIKELAVTLRRKAKDN